MTHTLHYYLAPFNFRGHKVLAAASFAGVPVEGKMTTEYPPSEAYKKKCSPLGSNPCLETPEGKFLFESNAMMRYFGRMDKTNALYGGDSADPVLGSTVDAWLDLCICEFDPLATHIFKAFFYEVKVPLPADFKADTECLLGNIENWLEAHSNERAFLVSKSISLADICLAFSLQPFYQLSGFGEEWSTKYSKIWSLYNAVMTHEATQAVLKSTGATFGIPAKAEASA